MTEATDRLGGGRSANAQGESRKEWNQRRMTNNRREGENGNRRVRDCSKGLALLISLTGGTLLLCGEDWQQHGTGMVVPDESVITADFLWPVVGPYRKKVIGGFLSVSMILHAAIKCVRSSKSLAMDSR